MDNLISPTKTRLFIAFVDMLGYAKLASHIHDPLQVFDLLDDLAKIIIRNVEATSGTVIKFIGDACLLVWQEECGDECVLSLRTMLSQCEAHLRKIGRTNTFRATVHFGEAAIGPFGAAPHQRIDVFGDSVNRAATLGKGLDGSGTIVSPQAFDKLSESTKTLFHRKAADKVYYSRG